MYKINSEVPINVWKEIAFKVQTLNFSDGSDTEFAENLKKLSKLLKETKVDLNAGLRNPKTDEKVGLATLLQLIYEITTPGNVKENFYKQIYTLSDLRIKNIKLDIFGLNTDCVPVYKTKIEERKIIKKAYTDGVFGLKVSSNELGEKIYNMTNIEVANYILHYYVSGYKSRGRTYNTSANLINFNGKYPSKKEISKLELPKLIVPEQTINYGEFPTEFMLDFSETHAPGICLQRKLTKYKN